MTTFNRPRSYEVTSDRSVKPFRSVARMTCSQCGAHDQVTINPGNDSPEFVAKLFAKRGWQSDAFRARSCICPSCSNARSKSDPDSEIRNLKVVTMAKPTPAEILAEAREATPQEKAAIRRRLDEVFDDAAGTYLDNQSDQKIGEHLNIPWALVRRVREAAYGPIRSDPELEKLRAELRAVLSEVETVKARVDRALSDCGAAFKRLGMS